MPIQKSPGNKSSQATAGSYASAGMSHFTYDDEIEVASAGDAGIPDVSPERQARDAWAWDEEEYVVL